MYKYNMGGTVPRETTIGGQRHNLAYINPFEEDLLQQYRQDAPTVPGPGGVPAYKNMSGDYNFSNTGGGRGDGMAEVAKRKNEQQSFHDKMTASVTRDDRQPIVYPAATNSVYTKPTTPYVRAEPVAPTVNINKPGPVVASSTGTVATPTISNLEKFANFLTQGSGPINPDTGERAGSDYMKYNSRGQLVYEIGHPNYDPNDKDKPVDPTLKNSFGITVGMGNTGSNDDVKNVYNRGLGSGIKADLDMQVAAGLFGTPEEMEKRLIDAGYSAADAEAYRKRIEASRAQGFPDPVDDGNDNPAATVSGIDPFAYTSKVNVGIGKAVTDPCPEGFIMDPKTNACVPMDATNSGYQGLPSYITPDASVPLTDFSQPVVIGQPNLQPYATGQFNTGTGGNFIQGSNVNQGAPLGYANGGPVGGIMDLLR